MLLAVILIDISVNYLKRKSLVQRIYFWWYVLQFTHIYTLVNHIESYTLQGRNPYWKKFSTIKCAIEWILQNYKFTTVENSNEILQQIIPYILTLLHDTDTRPNKVMGIRMIALCIYRIPINIIKYNRYHLIILEALTKALHFRDDSYFFDILVSIYCVAFLHWLPIDLSNIYTDDANNPKLLQMAKSKEVIPVETYQLLALDTLTQWEETGLDIRQRQFKTFVEECNKVQIQDVGNVEHKETIYDPNSFFYSLIRYSNQSIDSDDDDSITSNLLQGPTIEKQYKENEKCEGEFNTNDLKQINTISNPWDKLFPWFIQRPPLSGKKQLLRSQSRGQLYCIQRVTVTELCVCGKLQLETLVEFIKTYDIFTSYVGIQCMLQVGCSYQKKKKNSMCIVELNR